MSSEHPKYTFPNPQSEEEHSRLDLQSRALYDLMNGEVIHSKIPPDAKLIVDVGCGTGAMTLSLAFRNPSAAVIGLDLSRVPETHVTPPNVLYIQGDAVDMLNNDPRLPKNTADLIFSRLLIAGMPGGKWSQYAEAAYQTLKPGGFLEAHDVSYQVMKEAAGPDGKPVTKPIDPEWLSVMNSEYKSRGMDPFCGLNMPEYFKSAGLKNISVEVYKWPFGDWLKDREPNTAALGTHSRTTFGRLFAKAIGEMLAGKHADVEIKRLQDQVQPTLNEDGCYLHLYVVTGQKPPAS